MKPMRIANETRRLNLARGLLLCGFGLFLVWSAAGCSIFRKEQKPILEEYVPKPVGTIRGAPTVLTSYSSDEMYGRISKDGRQLVFASNQKGNFDIWIKDLATGIPKRVTDHVSMDTMPDFSPDGQSIVYVTMRDDAKGDIAWQPLDEEEPVLLTNRETFDQFPTFAPDGRSVLFSSGPTDRMRIMRYWFEDRRLEPLTDWGASQPAISSDGKTLAYIFRDEKGIHRVHVKDLETGKVVNATPRSYQHGFPTFSPDGQTLFFIRFYYTQPGIPLDGTEAGTIWSLPLSDIRSKKTEELEDSSTQITSGRYSRLFLQAIDGALVYTTNAEGNFDIWVEPMSGVFPIFPTAQDQLDYAKSLHNPYDSLFALRLVRRFPDSPEDQEAHYLASLIDRRMNWFDKQKSNLDYLDRIENPSGDWQGLARVDLAVWDAESTKALEVKTGVRMERAQAETAMTNLDAVAERYPGARRVNAYVTLRRGDMYRLLGNDTDAITEYEKVSSAFPDCREEGVQAKISLGDCFSLLRARDLQVHYYLTILYAYPEFEQWQRATIDAIYSEYRKDVEGIPEIISLLNPPEFDTNGQRTPERVRQESVKRGRAEVDRRMIGLLRSLIDENPDLKLLGAVLELKIARLYENLDRLELAIRAMMRVVDLYPEHRKELVESIFTLGKLSVVVSRRLREEGRFNEAASIYSTALTYYEKIIAMYPPTDENHRRAKKEYLALALMKAAQEEAEGDFAVAQKSYRRVLQFEPMAIQAHRKLIAYGVAAGEYKSLEAMYTKMIEDNPANYAAQYGLGYLITWRERLDEDSLVEAEEQLVKAMGLNSQSPYFYLTMGWIYEMRERYLGQAGAGYLEEAIANYDRAWHLNDQGADIQTEADILMNLGNVFVYMSNTWSEAYDFYTRREATGVAFQSKPQEMIYHLNFGRAAFNLDLLEEAAAHFETALALAKELNQPLIQAELIARLALNYQVQGNWDMSTAYFERAIQMYRDLKQTDMLAALMRSVALNYYYKGDRVMAMQKLGESLQLLDSYGTRPIGEFSRLALGPGKSLAPFGFDRRREEEVNVSLREQILEDMEQFRSAQGHLETKKMMMDRMLSASDGKDQEVRRELVVINNRQARQELGLGDDAAALAYLDQACLHSEALQSKDMDPDDPNLKAAKTEEEKKLYLLEGGDGSLMYDFIPREFESQIVNAAASAEIILREIAEDRPVMWEKIPPIMARLELLSGRYEMNQRTSSTPIVREDLVWRLYNDIALLSIRYGEMLLAKPVSKEADAQATFAHFTTSGQYFGKGIRNLKKVVKATRPPKEEEAASPPESPVPPYLRMRIHVQALINLSELAAYFEDDAPTSPSARSKEYLASAMTLCDRFVVEDTCLYARMISASRNKDLNGAESVIKRYVAVPPEQLGSGYLDSADSFRRTVFRMAVDLAIQAKEYARAWNLVELENRKLVADEIARTKYGSDAAEVKGLLKQLTAAVQNYRQDVEGQSYWEIPTLAGERRNRIAKDEEAIQAVYARILQLAPRLSSLMTVSAQPVDVAKEILGADSALVSVVPHGPKVWVFSMTADGIEAGSLQTKRKDLVDLIRRTKEFKGGKDAKEKSPLEDLAAALGRPILNVAKGRERIYLDIDRLEPDLPVHRLLADAGNRETKVLRVASVNGLIDAYQARNIYWTDGVITMDDEAEKDPEYKSALRQVSKKHGQIDWIGPKDLEVEKAMPRISRGGFALLNQDVVFEGHSAANVWLRFKSGQPGIGHYRFIEHFDDDWRSNVVILTRVSHTGRVRAERLFLERLTTFLGVPSFVTVRRDPKGKDRFEGYVKTFLGLWPGRPTGDAHFEACAKNGLDPDAVIYHGYLGMTQDQAKTYAKDALMPAIKRGVGYQTNGAPRAAVEEYERALGLIDFLQDTQFIDKTLEMLVQQSLNIRDYDRAIKYQHRILKRAEEAQQADASKIVPVLTAKKALADYYAQAKRFDEALTFNQQIIDTLLSAKRKEVAGPYYAQRGLIFELAGRYEESLSAYEESYQIFKGNNDVAGQIAQARNAARILRQRLSNPRKARGYVEQALALAQNAEPFLRLLLKLELARVHQALGNYQVTVDLGWEIIQEALSRIDEATKAAKGVMDNPELTPEKRMEQIKPLKLTRDQMEVVLIQAYLDVVNTLWLQGDYGRAMEVQQTGMALAQKNNDLPKQIMFNNAKGLIYASLGEMDKAVETFQTTLTLAVQTQDRSEEASAWNNLGDTYRKMGRFPEARRAFERSMEIDRDLSFKAGLAYDFANLGLTFESMKRYDEAHENFDQAIAISREVNNPYNEVKSLLGLGRVYIAQGDIPKAKEVLEAGLALALKLNMVEWEWKYRLHLGRILVSENQDAPALEQFMTAIQGVEGLPPSARTAAGAPKIEEETAELYEAAISLQARAKKTEEAFDLSERFRSRSYLDLLGSVRPKFAGKGAAALLAAYTQSRNEWRSSRDAYVKAAPEDKERMKSELDEARKRLDANLAELGRLEAELPAYVGVDAWPYERLRGIIPEGVGVVAYFQTNESLLIWVVTRDRIVMKEVRESKQKVWQLAETFREILTSFHAPEAASRELYTLLWAPVADELKNCSVVAVVPHGPLNFIPFAALDDGAQVLGRTRMLHTLSWVNGLRFRKTVSGSLAGKSVLGMGAVSPKIPFARHELAALKYSMPGANVYLQNDAKESLFKAKAPAAQVIHLATHVERHSTSPFLTSLELVGGENEDGGLQLAEVLELSLQADLVVLSACETGLGPIQSGDEVVSLSRAFLTAGAKMVVSSLWRVSDLSASLVMKHFVRRLEKGESPAEALRGAQMEVMKRFPHPAYWAGFRIEGGI